MKPILAMSYLCKKQKKNEIILIIQLIKSLNQNNELIAKKATLITKHKLNKSVKKNYSTQEKNAKALATLMGQVNANFCFQFPINVDQPEKFIWQMWLQNIDVQKDYCTYLPSLIKNKKFSQKKANFFEKIVYLPTNQYLSNSKIKLLKV
jgi:tRNA nucleotidyltransferase/poly(A) polymerase